MKRLLFVLILLSFSASAAPPEKWWEAYDRGAAAVNAKNYKVGAEALQKAILEMPNEGLGVRTKKSLITYVPHFYLGIAKYNLGDPDGALREWKICEDQGIVARTEYYAGMKDWIARAQLERQRNAQSAATGAKNAASTALAKAINTQAQALSAGGDRTDVYASANRKFQEATAQFQKAGTDVSAYKAAEQTAQQAVALFLTAIDEGKKLKLARAAQPKKTAPPVQQAQILTPAPAPVKVLETPPPPLATKQTPAEMTPVKTMAEVDKELAEREAKRKKAQEPQKGKPTVEVVARTPEPVSPEPVSAAPAKVDLKPAFRAFASGNLSAAEQLLSGIVKSQPAAAEAYLLRGCARYTQAMLSRKPDGLLMKATDDFRAALDRNRKLRLDRAAFSPKLVEFFEDVRRKRR